ncbi:hypothetical protein H340_00859 [Streptomyces mobaraensis NBRC 13819 = DSM 40847]|uniref:Uncharacterized protein n=1 Tax=Streptomyces mobaraensis (strain ATCC 29032 / DSM 40847 / JCM 4168 / NBRC 13819 / NCIMB 11159 / IPCR 16-22) TaxID=1223523 RepID=M3AAY4_STRM1|nr:hypothetical protein H340_00859 [Streptomyces mobaraensis NBRC 13819 = DSM 40847]
MLNSIFRGLRWLRDAVFLDIGPEVPVSPPAALTPPTVQEPPVRTPQLRCGCGQLVPTPTRDGYVLVPSVHGINIVRQPQAGETDR